MSVELHNVDAELKYPVVAHHRVIVDGARRDDAALAALFAGFDLVEPVKAGNVSSGGKYVSFNVSVRLANREETARLDEVFKQVPGLKMVL